MIEYLPRRSLELAKITKGIAEKRLADVPEEKRFWCSDGTVWKNLWELEIALRQMSEETFCHHSSETKSDFSNWVRDVIGDEKLASDLKRSTTLAQAAKSVSNRLAWLKNKMAPDT
jgi:hypothetical protein